jgi:predicted transposase YbfD/YdcC
VIIDNGNHYVIGVKKNQPTLYNHIEATIKDCQKHSSVVTTLENNRGRTEMRTITVSNYLEGISNDWQGLQQVIGVHRIVKEKGKTSTEMAYFISSRKSNAFLYEEGIRGHWGIENSLHYIKDVTMVEDASKIRTGNAPQVISTLKSVCLNIFRSNLYENMAQAIRLVSNDIKRLYELTT